jgi:hypothetical protein
MKACQATRLTGKMVGSTSGERAGGHGAGAVRARGMERPPPPRAAFLKPPAQQRPVCLVTACFGHVRGMWGAGHGWG